MAPPDYSFVTDIEVCKQRSKKTRDEDHADGTTSDCNLEDDEEKDNSDDEDYLPDFNQLEPLSIALLPPYIPSTSLPTQIPIAQLPALWYQHLFVFFEPVASPHSFQRSPKDVIDAYCQMRDLPEHDWKSPTFQETLTSSGLLAQLKRICRLGDLIETSHPDVERSFRIHDWKISFAEGRGTTNCTKEAILVMLVFPARVKPALPYPGTANSQPRAGKLPVKALGLRQSLVALGSSSTPLDRAAPQDTYPGNPRSGSCDLEEGAEGRDNARRPSLWPCLKGTVYRPVTEPPAWSEDMHSLTKIPTYMPTRLQIKPGLSTSLRPRTFGED
ncbi:hypothetical protein B0H16DRAFT_1447178 [Mycena metata]|uniref:Uncharacterized protein n=1 Tax=Mycena metata TaxID=1033252 RepID=A0AAD7KEA1_9AGAR|nr:hypothetical protein B0H16DRAFT_1447178 [Mycena metata]